ncbi:hypothetical protein N9L68_09365 [bacterium]|nr:hypothetical protein [bacterium]
MLVVVTRSIFVRPLPKLNQRGSRSPPAPRAQVRIYTSQELRVATHAITSPRFTNPATVCTALPIKFEPMRAAVVDLDPELSDAETQTVIGLIPSIYPSVFLHDINDAPMYVTRREYEVFRKRRLQYAEAQT